MAKSKLPSVDESIENRKIASVPVREALPKQEHEGYIPRRVDVKLTRSQAVILRDKLRLLQDSGAKTADGRFIASRAQAIQWILENEVVI